MIENQILKRRLSFSESSLLVENIKKTPNIIGYTVQEWMRSEHSFLALTGDTLIGACLNYDFHQRWRKVAALIVIEEYRSNGAGKALFYESCNDAIAAGKSIYTVSANPIVIEMMNELGFQTFPSIIALARKYPIYGISILLHSLRWLVSWYRIKETVRKAFQYSRDSGFTFGIKLVETDVDPCPK